MYGVGVGDPPLAAYIVRDINVSILFEDVRSKTAHTHVQVPLWKGHNAAVNEAPRAMSDR